MFVGSVSDLNPDPDRSEFFADPDLGFKSPDPSINKKDGYDKVLEEGARLLSAKVAVNKRSLSTNRLRCPTVQINKI